MKTQNTVSKEHASTIRAGLISLLVPLVCYLWMSGISGQPRAWLFMASFAICVVLMIQSIVDLLVLSFAVVARLSGKAAGRAVGLRQRATHRT